MFEEQATNTAKRTIDIPVTNRIWLPYSSLFRRYSSGLERRLSSSISSRHPFVALPLNQCNLSNLSSSHGEVREDDGGGEDDLEAPAVEDRGVQAQGGALLKAPAAEGGDEGEAAQGRGEAE